MSFLRRNAKALWWVLCVYAFSFASYLPVLLQKCGMAVPVAALSLRYVFVLIPALVSLVFLLREHAWKVYLAGNFKSLSRKEAVVCTAFAAIGIISSLGRPSYASMAGFLGTCAYLYLTAFAEEIAWRGFFQKRLGGRCPLLPVGLIWAFWHLPMWCIGNSLGLGEAVPLFLFAVLAAVVLGEFYFQFANVFSAALLHMVLNVFFLAPVFLNDFILFLIITVYYMLVKQRKEVRYARKIQHKDHRPE